MTVNIDLDALQAAAGIRIPLASSTRVRDSTVTDEWVAGFDGIRGVELVVDVPRLVGQGGPQVTVTVEQSMDGMSPETVHTFTFTNSGSQSFTADAPDDQLRVVCTPNAGLREAVVSVKAVPQFVDSSGGGGGGGSQPVSCVLRVSNLLVADADTYPIKWAQLCDNIWDQSSIAAIPDGLGLDFGFDGSDATITVTEAGTWSFSYAIQISADTHWRGYFSDQMASAQAVIGSARPDVDPYVAAIAATYYLPDESTSFGPQIITTAAANTIGLTASVTLAIVRIA